MRTIDRHFGAQSLLDLMRDRVTLLLEANSFLRALTEGRIYRIASGGGVRGLRPPFLCVAVMNASKRTFSSEKTRQEVAIGIFLGLEEPSEVIPEGARTVVTVEEEIVKALYADPYLKDPIDEVHLVERLHQFETVNFVNRSGETEGSMELLYVFNALYWLDQNVFTREQFAPGA